MFSRGLIDILSCYPGHVATSEKAEWLALREDDGRAYLLRRVAGEVKVKGLGRFDAEELLRGYSVEIELLWDKSPLLSLIPRFLKLGGIWPGGLRS